MGLFGLVPLGLMILLLKSFLDSLLGKCWGHFTYSIIVTIYCVALYPLVINLYHKFKEKKEK